MTTHNLIRIHGSSNKMGTVDEIVLAIDPALRKIEDILLWKNKLKTVLVFSFIHLVFWLFIIYNVRIYCIIASVFLFFHLLDAYRTKKRRELNKLKQQPPKKVIENISALGRYIIFVNSKMVQLYASLTSLKQKNKIQYFLVMLIFWSMLVVVGIKIKGLYLTYATFWLVFFLPPVLHYDLPRKTLRKCLPLLEQLDASMKYERRSIIDKNELLVDVRMPKMGIDDDEQEEEYLRPFKFDENVGKDVLEKLDDGDDDDDDETAEDYAAASADALHGIDDDEEVEEEFEYEVHQARHRTVNVDVENSAVNGGDDDDDNDNTTSYEIRNLVKKTTTTKPTVKRPTAPPPDDYDDDDDEVDASLLPNESLPSYMDVTNASGSDSFHFNYMSGVAASKAVKGDRVMKIRAVKNRPSLLDYYGEIPASVGKTTRQKDNNDIDETFDFLDEELKKY